MGKNIETARALARGWWELDVAERSRRRGYAPCDAAAGHRIAIGEGCLCAPLKPLQKGPDLVCESCFAELPYEPWDGGKPRGEGAPYLTVDEALATVGKKVSRAAVSPEPVATSRRVEPEPAAGGHWLRASIACLLAGGTSGVLAAVASSGRGAVDAEALREGLILGGCCGAAAWLVGLIFRRADLAARGRGTSADRPDAAWRLTPVAAILGAAVAVLGPVLIRWALVHVVARNFRDVSEPLARLAADPVATGAIGVLVAATLATLLPWARANLRGLGRGLGAVDGASRWGALLGALAVGGMTGGILAIRPDLARVEPGRAAPWFVYVTPVIGFLVGSRPRNALVRGLAGAAASYAILGAVATVWRPEFDPGVWLRGRLSTVAVDPGSWTDEAKAAACLAMPVAGALLGALFGRRLLSMTLTLLAATLAGCWSVIAVAYLLPEVTTRAPGALENVLTDVPRALGGPTVLLGAVAGLFAVAGATLGFFRGMLAGWLGLAIAYGLGYLGFVIVWPLVSVPEADVLGPIIRRGLRWVGLPAILLAPLAGYLLGRGRFAALTAGVLGYALGALAAIPVSESLGIDVGPTVAAEVGVRPVIWPALLAVGGIAAALGVLAALAVGSARRRWDALRYVNKFDCGWCGRRATRDARPAADGPLLPVCGDPLCVRELGRLLSDPTVRSLVAGPLRFLSLAEAPELPEPVQESAAPGRIERLRRHAQTYRPGES